MDPLKQLCVEVIEKRDMCNQLRIRVENMLRGEPANKKAKRGGGHH